MTPKLALALVYALAVGSLIASVYLESLALILVSIFASFSIIGLGVSIAGPRALNPFDRGQ